MDHWSQSCTLFDSFRIEDHWWYPHTDTRKIAGVLTYTSDDIILAFFGTPYPDPESRGLEDLQPRVIYGETLGGLLITVMNCNQRQGQMGSPRIAYSATHVFVGEHLVTDPEPRFPSTSVQYWS